VYPSVGDQPEFIGGERDSSPDKRRRGEEAKRLCEGLHSSAVSPLHVPGGAKSRGHALFIAPRSRPVNVLGPPMAALAGVNGHPGTRLLANLAAMSLTSPLQHQLGELGDGSHFPGRMYSPLPLESSVRPAPDEIRAGLMTVAPS